MKPESALAAEPETITAPPKQPVSVLVLIHTPDLRVLLLERAAHPGYWQSVTGSREADEPLIETARREVFEETGLDMPLDAFEAWNVVNRFEILPLWRHRYAAGVTHNSEYVFSLCLPGERAPRLAPDEHRAWRWSDLREAASQCFSWTNRDAILMLQDKLG